MSSHLRHAAIAFAVAAAVTTLACRDDAVAPRPGVRVASPDVTITGTSADVPAIALMRSPSYSVSMTATASIAIAATPVVRVYQDEQPWFGANRAHATLLALGKVLNSDYFIHPLSALGAPIPAGTRVVILTSNSSGTPAQATVENGAAVQANLSAFVNAGGTLIVDMGDNLTTGGFIAPGASGTPALSFPNPCGDATLSASASTHPIVLGPDGVVGGGDDLTDSNIDTSGCWVAHGNLDEGVTLPANARRIMTASFATGARTIMADYPLGAGCVILDTNTKEYVGQQPAGTGPTILMRNLFSAALRSVGCVIPVGIDVKPGSGENPINVGANGRLPVAILTTDSFDAATVNTATITLGDETGSDTPVALRTNGTRFASLEDADGDGDLDLVVHFALPALVSNGDLTPATTQLVLRGMTNGGTPIRGVDVVQIVP